MWRWVGTALRPLAGQSDNLLMVVPEDTPSMLGMGVETIASRGKYLLDLLAVIERKPALESMLIVNVDAVLISYESVRDFLLSASACGADFIWPMVPRRFLWPEIQDPKVTKYLSGSNNTLVQGNLIFIKGPVSPNMEIINRMNRCKLLADLIALGGWNLAKLATFRLEVSDIERRLGQLLGCNARLLECDCPEFAFDVDTLADLKLAELKLKARQVTR